MTDRPMMPDGTLIPGGPLGPAGLPLDDTPRETDAERFMREEGGRGVIPPSERGEDEARDLAMHDLESGLGRGLTRDEKDAAKHDRPRPTHREQDTPGH